jgi:hypothetical protein
VSDLVRELHAAAKARGLTVQEKAPGHFQILGGALLVNYYPTSRYRSAYVQQTRVGVRNVAPHEACLMALKPPIADRPTPRKIGGYRRIKVQMYRKQKRCRWCSCKLTIDTATVDHVVPLARGGLDNANNRVLACEPCNRARGSDMPEIREHSNR